MEKFDKIVSMGTVPSETNSENSNFFAYIVRNSLIFICNFLLLNI